MYVASLLQCMFVMLALPETEAHKADIRPDSRDVSVFQAIVKARKQPNTLALIDETVSVNRIGDFVGHRLVELKVNTPRISAMFSRLRKRNPRPSSLKALQSPGLKLISESDAVHILKDYRKKDFTTESKYSEVTVILAMSLPAFSPDGREAMVYVSNEPVGGCGSPSIILLKKSGDTWLVKKRIGLFIS